MDHAMGAFLGMLVGDASGAVLEFFRGQITSETVNNAMRMPGGGLMQVGRGQITDDGELALSLAASLIGGGKKNKGSSPRQRSSRLNRTQQTQSEKSEDLAAVASAGLPLGVIARSYVDWFRSKPFDIGNTCRTAFNLPDVDQSQEDNDCKHIDVACKMMATSAQHSVSSEANGALMRVVPLAIWCSFLSSDDLIASYARLDALLSHPSQVCQDCNALYTLAVVDLIQSAGSPSTKGTATTPASVTDRARRAIARVNAYCEERNVHPTVLQWLNEASQKDSFEQMRCNVAIGHVRHAFVMAFHFLMFHEKFGNYVTVIHRTLMKGGDTDTNAAIVGGMAGALYGASALPKFAVNPVLEFDCTSKQNVHVRPAQYSARRAVEFVEYLFT